MDVFPYAAFGIVATFFAISCLVLCTCAYLKIHVNFDGRGSDGDLPMCIPRSVSSQPDYQHRDSFGFGSIGGGPISSVSPNVSTSSSSSSSGSGGMDGDGFRSSILVCQQDGGREGEGQGGKQCGDSGGNEICEGGLGGSEICEMGGCSYDGGGDSGGGAVDCGGGGCDSGGGGGDDGGGGGDCGE